MILVLAGWLSAPRTAQRSNLMFFNMIPFMSIPRAAEANQPTSARQLPNYFRRPTQRDVHIFICRKDGIWQTVHMENQGKIYNYLFVRWEEGVVFYLIAEIQSSLPIVNLIPKEKNHDSLCEMFHIFPKFWILLIKETFSVSLSSTMNSFHSEWLSEEVLK